MSDRLSKSADRVGKISFDVEDRNPCRPQVALESNDAQLPDVRFSKVSQILWMSYLQY